MALCEKGCCDSRGRSERGTSAEISRALRHKRDELYKAAREHPGSDEDPMVEILLLSATSKVRCEALGACPTYRQYYRICLSGGAVSANLPDRGCHRNSARYHLDGLSRRKRAATTSLLERRRRIPRSGIRGLGFRWGTALDLNHRFSHDLALRGVYTWSKALDDGDSLNQTTASNAPGLVSNPFKIRADWGTRDLRRAEHGRDQCNLRPALRRRQTVRKPDIRVGPSDW
jgi:hypothetical protein